MLLFVSLRFHFLTDWVGTFWPTQYYPTYSYIRASQVAQTVKNQHAMRETQDRSLSAKDPLEEEMANHSSILAWEIPWTEEPGGLQSMGSQRGRHD